MTLKLPTCALLVLFLLALPQSALGEDGGLRLTLDPDATQVTFVLGATAHDVEGRLVLKSGELLLDPANGKASGDVALDGSKTETGSARRDAKMHDEVLLSDKHPLIRFEAQSMQGQVDAEGESEFKVSGEMLLAGQRQPMTLTLKIAVQGGELTGSTTFGVPFVAWGLNDPSVLFLRVDKTVQVTVAASGRLEAVTAEPNEP